MTWPRWLFPLILAGLASAGFLLMSWATARGIGLMPDSADYFSAARNLLDGNGLVVSGAGGAARPLVLWPPLYPFLLALAGLAGASLVESGRWLGAILFGSAVLLAGVTARRITRSLGAALLAAILVACSASLLETLSWGLSEGLFVVLYLATLLLLDAYSEERRPGLLVAAAFACGLACLARYSGVALIPVGVAVILWNRDTRLRRRFADAGVFTFFAAAPLAAWLLRNVAVAGSATDRPLLFHPVPGWKMLTALDTLASWFTTYAAKPWLKWTVLGATVASVILLLVRRRLRPRRQPALPRAGATLLFPVAYVLTVVASITFLDAFIPMDSRLLSPLLPVVILLLVRLGYAAWHDAGESKRLRVTLGVAAGILLCTWVVQAGTWAVHRSRDGAWYSSREWQNSDVMAAVRALPEETEIYSNVPEGVWFVTGRPASVVPSVVDHHTGKDNPRYLMEIDSLRARLTRGNGVLAYVGLETQRRWYLPTERELAARLDLVPLKTARDGTVWQRAAPNPAR